jgi:hypothetical protein
VLAFIQFKKKGDTDVSSSSWNKNKRLAIAAFVMSLVGFSFIAAIMGHDAMGQIKRNGEGGNGLAIAAAVIGWLSFGAQILFFGSFAAALGL